MGAVMAEETTDKVVIGELTVEPGSSSTYSFTVSLEGSETYYTAAEILFSLPSELTVAYTSGGEPRVIMTKPGLYPYDVEEVEDEETGDLVEQKVYKHTLERSMVGSNQLKVILVSMSNASFTATSGSMFKVYVKASPYLKPGDVEIGVSAKLVTADETKYEPADYVSTALTASATSTLTLKVSAENKYGTAILPFDYELPADGSLVAYTCSSCTDDALLLTEADKMAAYTPYIIYSANGFEQTISGTVDATKYPAEGTVQSGYLVGAVVAQTLTTGSYVMQNQGEGCMFYRVGDVPFAFVPGKCYVEMPTGTNAPMFRIGESTGIENHQQPTPNSQSTYNVLGQRVNHLTPGNIYIVNGRKVVIK